MADGDAKEQSGHPEGRGCGRRTVAWAVPVLAMLLFLLWISTIGTYQCPQTCSECGVARHVTYWNLIACALVVRATAPCETPFSLYLGESGHGEHQWRDRKLVRYSILECDRGVALRSTDELTGEQREYIKAAVLRDMEEDHLVTIWLDSDYRAGQRVEWEYLCDLGRAAPEHLVAD